MNKTKPVRDFLLTCIKALSKENFDEAVRIFLLNYLKCEECINVDGANDGGCDIKIFKNTYLTKRFINILHFYNVCHIRSILFSIWLAIIMKKEFMMR